MQSDRHALYDPKTGAPSTTPPPAHEAVVLFDGRIVQVATEIFDYYGVPTHVGIQIGNEVDGMTAYTVPDSNVAFYVEKMDELTIGDLVDALGEDFPFERIVPEL